MPVRIALFRGINVGGRNSLPMKALCTLLESLGCSDVKTYIQSGNVIFRHSTTDDVKLCRDIGATVENEFGFQPKVLLLTATELQQAVNDNPFADATAEPKTLHLWFLAEKVKNIDLASIESLKSESESFVLADRIFYLHAPDGIGRSKLAAGIEKLLGVATTARNWRTVSKILEMTQA
jgi:uncharacterized protein (DUF1697 family)